MKKTINELYTERNRVWENAKSYLNDNRAENGMLSTEDAAVYDRMESDVIFLGKEIERLEHVQQIDAELSRPVGTPLINTPGTSVRSGRTADACKGAMLTALRTNFRQVSNVLMEGADSAGGYIVPDEWDTHLIEKLEQENILRRLGTVTQTNGERKLNVATGKPAASWIEENGELVFGDAAFSQVILDAWKLSVAVKVSEELLSDNAYDL